MFTFISIMAVGVLIGYPLRRKQSIHKIPVLIQIVVCLLLFILGLSIGTNKLIIGNLSYFCQQAAIISMLSLLGSSVAALLVSHFFFKKGANREGQSFDSDIFPDGMPHRLFLYHRIRHS